MILMQAILVSLFLIEGSSTNPTSSSGSTTEHSEADNWNCYTLNQEECNQDFDTGSKLCEEIDASKKTACPYEDMLVYTQMGLRTNIGIINKLVCKLACPK